MFREKVVQNYMSAKGPSAASIDLYMDPDLVVDTDGFETVRLRSLIPRLLQCTFYIETAVSVGGPWRTLVTKTSSGESSDELECDPDATYRLDRYLRWHLVTTASQAWAACFTILGIFEPDQSGGGSYLRKSFTQTGTSAAATSIAASSPAYGVAQTINPVGTEWKR